MFKNSGMTPMPSGNSRQTSSVTPGRMVGLIMPTTPRQEENAMRKAFRIEERACARSSTVASNPLAKIGGSSTAAARLNLLAYR
jgi:hypothetical protein